ncbi:ABC transporter permease [Agromyces intestinalis]|uniref:ABC transporter permease n=1 Tax=Agromyces intestinalis TaxID=2592652 RepID=A0A5C1YFV6_9MICO|nr:ABC transporter permease [Agromyces intestinalis]QEO13909.1 ABC transporter permease [Agromyces intestinalis]
MLKSALSAARFHRTSLIGSALIVLLASALLTTTGVVLESGLRASASGPLAEGSLLSTIAGSFAGTTILIVVLVIGSTFAAALRQRRREFALLRAVGATRGQVRRRITIEVLGVFAVAAPLGALPGLAAASLLTPLLSESGIVSAGFAMTISGWPVLAMLLVLVPTGVLAARVAARETLRTSPVAAVAGSAVEAPTVGSGRRIAAVAVAVAGVLVALTPFFVPGTIGSATGAVSAFLLITAVALAGPLILASAARRALEASRVPRVAHALRGAGGTLALLNARGFSRRLTTAVVPLALLLALGTVQTGVNLTTTDAAAAQLRAGLDADLVVTAQHTLTAEDVQAVMNLPEVVEAAPTGTLLAETKVDDGDEELPFLGSVSWEPAALRSVPTTGGIVDPAVSAGSLADLGTGAVAVSAETVLGSGKGVGDRIRVRYADGADETLTIAAIFTRGLGFGDYLVAESARSAHGAPHDAVYLRLAPGTADEVRDLVAALGLESTGVAEYAEAVAAGGAAQQGLSTTLLLTLLAFIAIAAANTLTTMTAGRRDEWRLLHRTGATRRQLIAMAAVESSFVAITALVLGTAAVVPALIGVGHGLLGGFTLRVDPVLYGGLAASVVGIAVVGIVGTAFRVTRTTSPAT